jgi:hypothetical protein
MYCVRFLDPLRGKFGFFADTTDYPHGTDRERTEDSEHFDSHSDQNLSLFSFVIFCLNGILALNELSPALRKRKSHAAG